MPEFGKVERTDHRLLTGVVSRRLTSQQTQHTLCCVRSLFSRLSRWPISSTAPGTFTTTGKGSEKGFLKGRKERREGGSKRKKKTLVGISDSEFVEE